MKFALLPLLMLFLLCSCNEASSDSKEVDAEAGQLSVTPEQIDATLDRASLHSDAVAAEFVPDSLASGTLAVDAGNELAMAILGGSPAFCTANPDNSMCQSCGPSGELNGTQACTDFFCPGGEGYTEGDECKSSSGGKEGEETKSENDPCKDSDGFLDCQPTLVKLYLEMGKRAIGEVSSVLAEFKEFTEEIDGNTGTIETDNGQIVYEILAEDRIEFKTSNKEGEQETHFLLDGDNIHFAASDSKGESKDLTVVNLELQDDSNWEIQTMNFMNECDADDWRAPTRINIVVRRSGDVWQGKAMMYNPLWQAQSCSDIPSEATEMNIYTDFVGEDAMSTASVYMLKSSVTDLSESMETHGIENVSTNFPKLQFEKNNVKNPFCSLKDGTITWGAACSGATAPEVNGATYLGMDKWMVPADLKGDQPKAWEAN
jgi:hypothetical protein